MFELEEQRTVLISRAVDNWVLSISCQMSFLSWISLAGFMQLTTLFFKNSY